MRVVVLYNAVSQQDTIEDLDVLVQVDVVSHALSHLGHDVLQLACALDLNAIQEELQRLQPDVVFNLVESLRGNDSLIHIPPAVLDAFHWPYTGASAESLFLTTHKLLAKQRLFAAGLPTPCWVVEDTLTDGPPQGLDGAFSASVRSHAEDPAAEEATALWIIKGVWEQGSRDMDDDAVLAGSLREVRCRLRERVARTGRPAFAEAYVEGREFNLALLTGPGGVELLPTAEIDFSAFPAHKPRIVGYRAKWQADSFEYNNTPHRFDFAAADRPLLDTLEDLARQCWGLFMLRGYGRVDFRVDQEGRPWILEVNANPCLSPDAGFAAALQFAGIEFRTAIKRILDEAVHASYSRLSPQSNAVAS
jgi:D-alanine-D-alanine ligase